MGDLTKNFSIREFRVSAKYPELAAQIPFPPPDELKCYFLALLFLQPVRDQFPFPMEITSGKRSVTLNRAVGGVPDSAHRFRLRTGACDWRFADRDAQRLREAYAWAHDNLRWCYGEMILYLGPDETPVDIHVTLPTEKERGQTLIKMPDGHYKLFEGALP